VVFEAHGCRVILVRAHFVTGTGTAVVSGPRLFSERGATQDPRIRDVLRSSHARTVLQRPADHPRRVLLVPPGAASPSEHASILESFSRSKVLQDAAVSLRCRGYDVRVLAPSWEHERHSTILFGKDYVLRCAPSTIITWNGPVALMMGLGSRMDVPTPPEMLHRRFERGSKNIILLMRGPAALPIRAKHLQAALGQGLVVKEWLPRRNQESRSAVSAAAGLVGAPHESLAVAAYLSGGFVVQVGSSRSAAPIAELCQICSIVQRTLTVPLPGAHHPEVLAEAVARVIWHLQVL
jgi:hypothetical protein